MLAVGQWPSVKRAARCSQKNRSGAAGQRSANYFEVWAVIQIWSSAFSLFPEFDFVFPFPHTLRFPFSPGKFSTFFCKIHKLPAVLCHFPQFRRKSVKFAAKNARFAEESAKFCKNPEISKKTCKITQKFALERCKGVTIFYILKNAEK